MSAKLLMKIQMQVIPWNGCVLVVHLFLLPISTDIEFKRFNLTLIVIYFSFP